MKYDTIIPIIILTKTCESQTKLYVNALKIREFYRSNNLTILKINDNENHYNTVEETPEEIMELLRIHKSSGGLG